MLMSKPLFNKVSSLRPKTSLKRRLQHSCFPVNFTEFLGALFIEHLRATFSE